VTSKAHVAPDSEEAARPARTEFERGPSRAERRGDWRVLTLALLAILGWFMLIQRFGEGDVYAVVGPYALIITLLLGGLRLKEMRRWFKPSARALWLGVAVGVGMTVLTYPVFQLASWAYPELDAQVQGLYTGARSTTLAKALAWVVVLDVAEEVLFRGVLAHELQGWLPERKAFMVSLTLYALAQFGTGSWIVAMLALVCGAVWTVQRIYTGTILSPLIAHLIWTPTVILLYPVT
jgi:membrane protease YdiL (CAAX protease family)